MSEKGFLQDVRHNFVGYFARMRARSGLRQLNSGEISRKVGRVDCGNDFSDTLYGRLKKRIWVFSEEIPYGVG